MNFVLVCDEGEGSILNLLVMAFINHSALLRSRDDSMRLHIFYVKETHFLIALSMHRSCGGPAMTAYVSC